MVDTVQSAVYRMGLDPGQYVSAAAAVDKANQNIVASTGQVVVAEERVTAAETRRTSSFSKLEAGSNRLIAIEQRRQAAIQRAVATAEREGIAQQRLAAHLATVNAQYNAQVVAAQRLNVANANLSTGLARATGQSRAFGFGMQNAAFQIGDFAVQVASGSGVIRPLIQQGSQLLQVFGPIGAVLGALGAIVGALAVGLLGLSDSTSEASKEQEKHNDLMERAKKLTDDLAGSTYDLAAARRFERDNLIEQARAQTQQAQATIAQMTAQAESRLNELREEFGGDGDVNERGRSTLLSTLVPEAAELERQIRQWRLLRAELGEFEDQISRGTVAGVSLLPPGWEEDRAKAMASLREEFDLVGKVGLQREIAIELAKQHTTAETALGEEITRKVTAIYEAEQAQKAANEADKEALRLVKERAQRQLEATIQLQKSLDAEQATRDALDKYIDSLRSERQAVTLSAREQFIRNKLLEAEKLLTEATIDNIETRRAEIRKEAGDLYDLTKAQKDAQKAAEEAAKERERQAEQNARALAAPFENALDGIQDSFTDFFETVFSGGIDTFKDLAGGIKQIFIRLAAEMAALMVFRPSLGGLGLGGLLTGAGASSAAAGSAGGGTNFGSLGGDIFSLGRQLAGGAGIGSFLFGGSPLTGAGGLLTGGGVTSSGAGAVSGGLFGTGSSFLATNGLGILGSVLPGLLSGNFAQAGLGGAGALAGSLILPGIGTIAGGILGNIIGGLFGGSKKKTPQSVTDITIGAGGLAGVGGNYVRSGGNVAATTSLADAIAASVNEAVSALGGQLSAQAKGGYILTSTGKNQGTVFIGGVGGSYGKGQEVGTFADAEDAAARVIVGILQTAAKQGTLTGISATERTVLTRSKATDLETLNADLTFAQIYDQLTGIVEEATNAEKAIEELNKQFTDAKNKARDLGLSVAALATAQAAAIAKLTTDFNASIQDQILAFTNPSELALRELERAQAARLKEAQKLGADLVEVERLSGLERQKVLEQTASGLRAFFDEITFGGLSGASPGASLQGSRAAFEAAAASGDTAGVQTYGRAYLESARSFYASGAGFQDALSRVQGVAGGYLTANDNSTAVVGAVNNVSALMAASNNLAAQMLAELAALREDNRELREQLLALAVA